MNSDRLRNRLESMRSCLEAASHLDDCPVYPVKTSAITSAGVIQGTMDRHRLSRKHISHILNAIVFEIAVKVIWELDNDRECSYTHNIGALYRQLSERSRREMDEIYHEKSAILAGLEGTDKKGNRIQLSDLVEFQSLEEALIANEDTMKNFKYDGVFNGKSSAMGSVMWDKERDRIWTLPPLEHVRLPEALYHYTMARLEKAQQDTGLA